MYDKTGIISDAALAGLKNTLRQAKWEIHESKITSHQAAPCTELPDEIKSLGGQASFLRLKAGGKLYRHRDEGFGYNIPLETNDDCLSFSYKDGRLEQHLEVGKIYHCDRSIEHESVNNGRTDRTHLIILLDN